MLPYVLLAVSQNGISKYRATRWPGAQLYLYSNCWFVTAITSNAHRFDSFIRITLLRRFVKSIRSENAIICIFDLHLSSRDSDFFLCH
jgi:hypothetical protein